MDFRRRATADCAVRDVDLAIEKGEVVSIIGHSGCGKSTLLNIVAGLLHATSGVVILDGKEVNGPGPDRAVVFQNHSLLPWLSAYGNVRLAVDKVFRRPEVRGRAPRVDAAQSAPGPHGPRRGEAARTSSRAACGSGSASRARWRWSPRCCCMDEPFGALDALTRAHLQDTLMEIQARLGNTVITITHDVDEAVLLADRIVMMTNGPAATIGQVLRVDLPRPRKRLELTEHPTYIHARAELLRFLYQRQAVKADAA